MDVFAEFATDEKKETGGIWKRVSPVTELLIARTGNDRYARLLSAKYEEHQRALDLKSEASEQLSKQIMIEVMAETILLGWRGEMKAKGEALTYSVANATRLLGVKDFRALVNRLASDFDSYRAAQEEAVVKS